MSYIMMTIVIQMERIDMKIPVEIKKWMKEHTTYDLEEYLLNDELADKAKEILELISELNEDEALKDLVGEEALA